jgi:hypothetical protein
LSIALECPQEPTNPSHNPLDQVKTSELNEDTVEEREYKEFEDVNVEMSALECTYNGCTKGEVLTKPGSLRFPQPRTKFQSSDGHIFHVDRDIVKGQV